MNTTHKPFRDQYLLDLFGGVGLVARASRKYGPPAYNLDGRIGAGDITRPGILCQLKCDTRDKRLTASAMAPPCGTFPMALQEPLRELQFTHGKPGLTPYMKELLTTRTAASQCCHPSVGTR